MLENNNLLSGSRSLGNVSCAQDYTTTEIADHLVMSPVTYYRMRLYRSAGSEPPTSRRAIHPRRRRTLSGRGERELVWGAPRRAGLTPRRSGCP